VRQGYQVLGKPMREIPSCVESKLLRLVIVDQGVGYFFSILSSLPLNLSIPTLP